MSEWPSFTKRTFLALPLEQQHKKCAELLRRLYIRLLNREDIAEGWEIYCTLSSWMSVEPVHSLGMRDLADRYHLHLKEAKQALKEHNLLPAIQRGDRSSGDAAWPVHVYLDNIRSAHNVGSVLRTVEAFALGKVYFSTKTPFIDQRQVQQTSMGCWEWVVCHQVASLEELPRPLIALETSPEAVSLYNYPFPDCFTLVLGNEEYGCSEETLKQAEDVITIGLRGRKNSLNVANAFAIVAAEITRLRTSV